MTKDEQTASDHVAQTIATYNAIATYYKLTATAEMRAWEEKSMRTFAEYVPARRVLVPGCGDGRDSRFLRSLGMEVSSFDLSEEMLKIARAEDPEGDYFRLDLREMDRCQGLYDGIFASGCLYHVTKKEFKVRGRVPGTAFTRRYFLSEHERGAGRKI